MSKTKIPESVAIYGQNVPVIFEPGLTNDKGEEIDGLSSISEIHINSCCKRSEHLGILLHEMAHIYFRRNAYVYRDDWDDDLEEQIAEGFATIIQENFILRSR